MRRATCENCVNYRADEDRCRWVQFFGCVNFVPKDEDEEGEEDEKKML